MSNKNFSSLLKSTLASTIPQNDRSLEQDLNIVEFDKVLLNQISLYINSADIFYVWLDNRSNRAEMQIFKRTFAQHFTHFQAFDDTLQLIQKINESNGQTKFRVIAGLSENPEVYQSLNRHRDVDLIVAFGQNQPRIRELLSRYPKIVGYGTTSLEILQSELTQTESTFQNSVFFNIPEDTQHIEKLIINYRCLLGHEYKESAKQDFQDLVSQFYLRHHNAEIQRFQREYFAEMNKEAKTQTVLYNMFTNKFYSELVENLPKITQNPLKLAYLRTPFKDLFMAILSQYTQVKQQLWPEVKNKIFIVVVKLSKDERLKLRESQLNYLVFTSFAKGFTSQKLADQYIRSKMGNRRNDSYFKFHVKIPREPDLHKGYDFGFVVNDKLDEKETIENGGNVLFNIYNFFKVTFVDSMQMTVCVNYGGLADVEAKFDQEQYRLRLDKLDWKLLNFYRRLQPLIEACKDQGATLDLCGFEAKALRYYTRVHRLQSDGLKFQKGKIFAKQQKYTQAIITFLQIREQTLRILAFIHILGICVEQGDLVNGRKYLKLINSFLENLEETGYYEECFRAKHYEVQILMQEQDYRLAYYKCRNLLRQIMEKFAGKTSLITFLNEVVSNEQKCAQIMLNEANL